MSSSSNAEIWDVTAHTHAQSISHIGKLIDASSDEKNSGKAQQALQLCEKLEGLTLSDTDQALLSYFRANAWSSIRNVNHGSSGDNWAWEQQELLQEVYLLRSAIRHAGFPHLEPIRQCQILTNAGNLFSHIGRPIEAIEYWQRVLGVMPNFAMALGNLGLGLKTYALYLYDRGHAVVIMKIAYNYLMSANMSGVMWESSGYVGARSLMLNEAKDIATHLNLDAAEGIELNGDSIGRSKAERNYRTWCLDNVLFLNPLNDSGNNSIAACDVISLPNLVTPAGKPPSLIGFYNQLKQEFVSARFILWEGKDNTHFHFSDRNVYLIDTLDYPLYSLQIEKTKLAYIIAYSIFDKIAFFINEYWKLGVKQNNVYFHSIWFKKGTRRLRKEFKSYENLPLRGLFWLSKDFLKDNEGNSTSGDATPNLAESMEPDARALRSIRNHLEHKYIKVHDEALWSLSNNYRSSSAFKDDMAFSLTRESLEAKTLRLLKLARAGLIYLSLAVHREESLRAKCRSNSSVMPMHLPKFERL